MFVFLSEILYRILFTLFVTEITMKYHSFYDFSAQIWQIVINGFGRYINFNKNFKHSGEMEKRMSYDLSRFSKMTFENFLGIPRLSAPKFTFSLRHRCSLKLLLNRAPSHPSTFILSALLNLLLDLGFLLVALPLLPCFPILKFLLAKSLVRKTNKTSIHRLRSRTKRENLLCFFEIPMCDFRYIYGIRWTVCDILKILTNKLHRMYREM